MWNNDDEGLSIVLFWQWYDFWQWGKWNIKYSYFVKLLIVLIDFYVITEKTFFTERDIYIAVFLFYDHKNQPK